jgi:tetratricopeptide (TPR) repeat protein
VDAGDAPNSGGLINPFAESEEPEEPGGGQTSSSGGLIDPFAVNEPEAPRAPAEQHEEDGTSPAPAEDTEARAEQHFEEAEALYKGGQYAKAAEQYRLAYKYAGADRRGALAFNVAQAFRQAKSFAYAAVWYQKALALGGPEVSPYRQVIDEHLAQMQDEMKKNPERGPDGEDIGEARMLFEEAEIAYAEGDYAKAEPLYKEAYARSKRTSILFNIGQACRLQGKYADAKHWYREYLRQAPDSPVKAEVEELIEAMKQKAPDPPEESSEASPAPAEDPEARAKQHFDEGEALYKAGQYGKAAEQYQLAYKDAGADRRGALAFNIAQSFRYAKSFPFAAAWYQKALGLGGPHVSKHREEIEECLALVQGEMKKQPERGPDGEDIGEAKMLFQLAEIAYAERDYATAEPLYRQAYHRSNQAAILFNIGQACRFQGKYADAKFWYREYLRQAPDSPVKADVEQLLEEMKQKVPDLPEEGSQDDAKEKFEQAESLYKEGKFSEAADLYVEVFHDPAVAYARGEMAYNMGQCQRQTGKSASAVEWYKIALEHLPDNHAHRTVIADYITELTGAKVAQP